MINNMFGEKEEILPGMTVLHDDGLTYRIDRVDPSTDGFESEHRLDGLLRVAYTQLDDGDFPAGTGWSKDGGEFRLFFTPVAPSAVETEHIASAEIFASLNPEEQKHAESLQAAMVEKFSTHERPLSTEDFDVVANGNAVYVMLITTAGLYKGSFDAIMKKRGHIEEYVINVGNKSIDTRFGMDMELYKAFVHQIKATGDGAPLPDMDAFGNHTSTWMTGEEELRYKAHIGFVDRDGSIGRTWLSRESATSDLRFRPAALVNA